MGSSSQFSKHQTYKLLISAATLGDASYCESLLINGLNVNAADNNGVTALIRAATNGHVDVIDVLLKYNADITLQDITYGNNALHEAAWRGFSRTVAILAKALGPQKGPLHSQNISGFAPLHLACQNGHNQTCRELLQAGCNPDLQNNNGDTPLHIASAMNRRKLTRILLEAGCDTTLTNKQGETARDIALRKNLADILEILDTLQGRPRAKPKPAKPEKNRQGAAKMADRPDGNLKKKYKHKKRASRDQLSQDWSPYGCHYSPDLRAFPQPRLDTLPSNPLSIGEQYYLDLAGNIKKGPVGVGHICYCAPLFKHIEVKMKKNKAELKARLEHTHEQLQTKVTNLEQKTQVQVSELTKCVD